MESFSGSEHGTAEIYMVQGTESNPHLASTSSLGQQFEVMGNEGAPEFIVDQGLYYPAATNYYGYYSTGFESAGEWDDNQRFLALDSPSIQYPGLQTENLPYVYYTPTYGYSQSPYNPYNPYIPGAVIGVDGSFVGMQQYYPGPTYQHSPSSPSYYPYLVQPVTENVPISAQEPHFLNVGVSNSNGSDGSGLKHNLQEAPGGTAKLAPRPAQVDVDKASNQSNSHGKRSEASKTTVTNSKQPATNKSTATLSVSHATSSQATQGRHASGAVQGSDQLTFGQIPPLHSPAKVPTPVTNASADFRSSTRGWPMADKLRPRLQYGGVSNNGNGNPDFYNEQNRGPRINKSRGQWTQSSFVDGYTANGGTSGTGGEIIIHPDQYNKEDFPVSYTDGKFFVIKSYSEDDVHKSIKYGVWSSTPNGNKRLDSAYGDAQRIAAGVPRGCPIFLFFSVNASGQFCGVAEMVGPVDFNKDMNFWQQDKWSGSFPVKWHIIKDVPNTNFRHIILENNENKPVTNSRDTQEIKFRPGMEMLNIFKNYTSKTSILDDFLYYEERQKILQEEKARRHGKSYDSSFYMPAFVPMRKPIVGDDQNESAKSFSHPSSSGRTGAAVGEQVPLKSDVTNSSSHEEDSTKRDSVQDEKGLTSVMKIGSLTIDPKPAAAAITKAVDVFTVGSMPVKVNGFSEASSATLTVGSIPIVPKGLTCDKPSTESSSGGV